MAHVRGFVCCFFFFLVFGGKCFLYASLFNGPLAAAEEDAKALAAADPTSAFLVSTQAIAVPLLHSLLGGLTWSDSVSLRRVAEVSVRVVQLKAEDPNYFQVLGQDLLTAALRTLSTTQVRASFS
jgi:hypothetical protein